MINMMHYYLFFIITLNIIWLPFAQATLQFSETNYRINENEEKLTLTVKRLGNLETKIVANYATRSGSAKAGSDFAVAKGLLAWTVGENREKSFDIIINDDALKENNETFIVTLGNKNETFDTIKITIVDNEIETLPAEPEEPKIETITTLPPSVSYQPPTTGEIHIIYNYQGDTINDATIGPNGNIADATLAGEIINEGMVSNSTVVEDATLEGGTVSGDLDNQGTIKNITFVGRELKNGQLGGTITVAIDDRSLGFIQDVSLLPDTLINGGQLTGQIAGHVDGKAKFNRAKLRNIELSNVIIGADCELAEDVILGEGVRFVDNATIPEDVDLTEALSTEDGIDINTDIVTDGPSLLSQINDLPDMQTNGWALVQNQESGNLEVMVDGRRLGIKPKQVKQAKRHRKGQININDDGTATVITAQGREILVEIKE
jgi:hypothetical protein